MKLKFLAVLLFAGTAAAAPVDVPVVYYRLGNGLKVVISEAHAAPTVTVAVYYGIGFRVEPLSCPPFCSTSLACSNFFTCAEP